MPCDTIRTVKVNLASLGRIDVKLLAEALQELGLTIYEVNADKGYITANGATYAKGKLEVNTRQAITQEQVCAAYSKANIAAQCKRFGWAFKETTTQQQNEVRR